MPRLNEETGLKECSKCHEYKPAEMFHKNKPSNRRKDSLHSYCKNCISIIRNSANYEPDCNLKELKCSKCKETKPVSLFGKDKNKLNGYSSNCKDCNKSLVKHYEIDSNINAKVCVDCKIEKEIVHFGRCKRRKDGLMTKCKSCVNSVANMRNDTDEKRLSRNTYIKDKYANDHLFAIKMNYATRLRSAIRDLGLGKDKRSIEYLGTSILEFSKHLESMFKEGMTFDEREKWHLDHFIPISLAKTEEDIDKLSHFTNIRPLWVYENLNKRNHVPPLDEVIEFFKNYPDSPTYKFYLETIRGIENE
jgi:hypothetical protein